MERFDANKDGKLDETERAKALEAFQNNFGERLRKGKRAESETKGEGPKTEESVSKLTAEERAKAQAEFEKIFEKEK